MSDPPDTSPIESEILGWNRAPVTSRDDHAAAIRAVLRDYFDEYGTTEQEKQAFAALDALLVENQKLRLENISLIGQAGETQAENQKLREALNAEVRVHHGTMKARHKAEAENQQLREIVENFTEHQSWRCQYRTRYEKCLCGLDEQLAALGLPPCDFHDPEAVSEHE